MDVKLPKRLSSYEPCKEATVELRFTSNIPSEAILGFVFQKLQDRYGPPKSLPIMQLPQNIRESDPNLKFAPYYIMENDSFQINIGPKVIAIINRAPYIGWQNYYSEIENVLTALASIPLFKTISRLGVRYINFFDQSFDMTDPRNINIHWESPFKNDSSNTSYSTLVDLKDFTSLLRLQSNSTVLLNNKQHNGTILDIDTYKNFPNTGYDNEIFQELIQQAHLVEKEIFFTLLTPKFIDEKLGAIYAD